MAHDTLQAEQPTWLRARALRGRWGDMPASTFYERLKKGLIPPPERPFGTATPFWRLSTVEAFEQSAQVNPTKAPVNAEPLRGSK